MKSAGVEIDPTSRGIIFSLLGLPGGSKIQNIKKIPQIPKQSKKKTGKIQKNPKNNQKDIFQKICEKPPFFWQPGCHF